MGDLYYGSARTRVHCNDVLLHHLSAVVTAKLRRNEPFLLSWRDSDAIGDGTSAIWVHPTVDLHYKYESAAPAELDRELLDRMSRAASSPRGLFVDDATLLQPAENAATA